MDLPLQDKVILVTGGAKGIGAAIVRACAAENAKVVQALGNFGKLDGGANAGVNDKVGLEHGNPNDCLLTVHNGHTVVVHQIALERSRGPHHGSVLACGCGNVHLDRGLT